MRKKTRSGSAIRSAFLNLRVATQILIVKAFRVGHETIIYALILNTQFYFHFIKSLKQYVGYTDSCVLLHT